MKKPLILSVMALLISGAAVASQADGADQLVAKDSVAPYAEIVVFRQDAAGRMELVGSGTAHDSPVQFSREFSYLVATNGPRDGFDGHWSMKIDHFQYSANGGVAFDVSMEGRDPGVWEGNATNHIMVAAGTDGVIHGIDGQDYVIKVHLVEG